MWERPRRTSIRLWRLWRLVPFADKLNAFVGVGSLLFSAVALSLAVSALRMGERQEQMANRQTVLAERQGQIAERQAEIAETQLTIQQKQLSREAKLHLTEFLEQSGQPGRWRLVLWVYNTDLGEHRVRHASVILFTEVGRFQCEPVAPLLKGDDWGRVLAEGSDGRSQTFALSTPLTIAPESQLRLMTCDLALTDVSRIPNSAKTGLSWTIQTQYGLFSSAYSNSTDSFKVRSYIAQR